MEIQVSKEQLWFKCWKDTEVFFDMLSTDTERVEFMRAVFDYGFRHVEYTGENKYIQMAMVSITRSIDLKSKRGRPETYQKPELEDVIELMHEICKSSPDIPDDEGAVTTCRNFHAHYSADNWKNYRTPEQVKAQLERWLREDYQKRTSFTGKPVTRAQLSRGMERKKTDKEWEEYERQLLMAQRQGLSTEGIKPPYST